MDENNNTEPDFQGALAEEFDLTPEPPEAATPPAPAPIPTAEEAANAEGKDSTPAPDPEKEEGTPEPVAPVTPPTDAEKTDEEKAAETELAKDETPEQTTARHEKEVAGKVVPEVPKYATKDDLKDAIKEYETDSSTRVSNLSKARDDIIGKLHPEGVDTNIYDTNGQVIKTAQDIVDRELNNQRTGEPFTYEEAASFILESSQQMTKNVEELKTWAETTAEKNISLIEGHDRVMSQWADVLKTLPAETVETLGKDYMSTQVKWDKTNSYITEMGMPPERFYEIALSPYRNLGEQMSKQSTVDAEAKAQAEAKAKEDEQSERSGLPPQRGQSDAKANTGDPMLDALVDELNKG